MRPGSVGLVLMRGLGITLSSGRTEEKADGTSNTFLVVEAGKAVPWTKPDDLPFGAGQPLPKLGGQFGGGFNALFADGSVRFFQKNTGEKGLRARVTRNGGAVVED